MFSSSIQFFMTEVFRNCLLGIYGWWPSKPILTIGKCRSMCQIIKIKIKFTDIEFTFDFALFGSYDDAEVYLCTETGKFFYSSDFIDEEEEPIPDDIYENEK